jgi:hypothetical protein
MTVYYQLVDIAAEKHSAGYLNHYTADLTEHDKRTLAQSQAGQRYIWILRTHGTALFPVAAGHDSVWATYWLDKGNDSRAPSLCYLISIASDGGTVGTVKAITYDRARRLATEPHPHGRVVKFSLS